MRRRESFGAETAPWTTVAKQIHKMKLIQKIASLAALTTALLTPGQLRAQIAVDLELILLTDVSGSITTPEYELQKGGYVSAFQNASVQGGILAGSLGRIAVTYVEWSGAASQFISVGWTLIDSIASSNAFAAAINGSVRSFSGQTAPGSAINFATPLFSSNRFDGTRQVIDVSGDGVANEGADTGTARNNALFAGVDAINGITIGDVVGLQLFYQTNVVGGLNSFHTHATTFADFDSAIERKLVREITGNNPVPEPSTYGLFGVGALIGVVIMRRRKTRKTV